LVGLWETATKEAAVRWEALFRDLEAQFDAAEDAELSAEVSDRTRIEAARLRLVDRLRAAVGGEIAVRTHGDEHVRGRLAAVGSEWLVVEEPGGRGAIVPFAAVVSVRGLTARTAHPGAAGIIDARLGIGHAFRQVARDRAEARLTLVDGTVVTGTVDRVGRDFLEITERSDDARARGRSVTAVAIAAVAVVRVR
jgi:hypothetical protein